MPSERINSKKIKGEYHCPFSGCLYNGLEKSFSGKKFLDQHIAKVHAEKKYICEKCGKGFGLDWWRKHHEKTCGVEWICDCGRKYTSRESLLTHARRGGHDLPEHVLHTKKPKQVKTSDEAKENTVIVLIQPIIQEANYINRHSYSILNPQPILPKPLETYSMPPLTSSGASKTHESISLRTKQEPSLPIRIENVVSLNSTSPTQKAVATQTTCETEIPPESCLKEDSTKHLSVSIATQTNEIEMRSKYRESRASQCSRRKSKSTVAVRNESTHTQTAESAVVKIKRKRSRRKSVAITTEPISHQNNEQSTVWPNFTDLILQNPEPQSLRNTMSTQTNCYMSKVLCDSQTITDEELFDWAQTIKKDYESDICKQPFGLGVDISENPLSSLPNSNFCSTLPEFDLFSPATISKEDTKIDNNFTHGSSLENKDCSVLDIFSSCPKLEVPSATHPVLSDIHTQTISNTELDFSLLANMETQTTDDFTLYDFLEFSDTETQTPWEDFPDLEKSPLPPDQFSIEIQTDFPSLADLNTDPYAFINDINIQKMIDACEDKERLSVNIETQTHDLLSFPQLTNSGSQTLDVADLML